MRSSYKIYTLIPLLTLGSAMGQIAAGPPKSKPSDGDSNHVTHTLTATDADARLKFTVLPTYSVTGDFLRLHVTFENVSDHDTVLNLGSVLSNGTVHLPSAIRLILTDSKGNSRELHFFDKKFPGVAGRVDDYLVPLAAGSTCPISLGLEDYWCPESKEFQLKLNPETYRIKAVFTGKTAAHLNGDTERPNLTRFWIGTIESNVATIHSGKSATDAASIDGAKLSLALSVKDDASGTLVIRNDSKRDLKIRMLSNRLVLTFLLMDDHGNIVKPTGKAKVDTMAATFMLASDASHSHSFQNLDFLTGTALFGYTLEKGKRYRVVAVYRPWGPNGPGIASNECVFHYGDLQ